MKAKRRAEKKITARPAKVDGPSAIARAAGVSKQLVSRKLKQGKTRTQIIREAEIRRERLRQKTVNNGRPGFDGRPGDDTAVTYAEAQRLKEVALARIRQLELEEKVGALVRADEVRRWASHLLRPMTGALRHLPSELRDQFSTMTGPQFESLLQARIDAILSATVAYLDSCAERAGKPLSDGSLVCGCYRVRWVIEPMEEERAK